MRLHLRYSLVIGLSICLICAPLSSAFATSSQESRNSPPQHLADITNLFTTISDWFIKTSRELRRPAPSPLIKVALQGSSPNLDTMRGGSPSLPPAYQSSSTFPPATYDDPKPTNTANFDSYLTGLPTRGNATGIAGSLPLQAADTTAGSASVGGWSYNLDSQNYNFTAPVLGLP